MGFTDFKFKFPSTEATSTATPAREISYPRQQSSSIVNVPMARKTGKAPHKFRSYMLKGEYVIRSCYSNLGHADDYRYSKPWLKDKRFKKSKINNIIVITFFVLGCGVCALMFYDGYRAATPPGDVSSAGQRLRSFANFKQYCLVVDDDFKSIDSNNWGYEIQV